MHASIITQQAAAAPTGRGAKVIARAVSVNKVPGLGTQGTPGTVSIRERPAKARAVAISMPGWLPNEEGSRKTKSKSSKSSASGVPVTKREAMFAIMGMFVGGAAVGGAILTRFDVDKEAARVALDALMEDQNFRAAVTEQVLKEELKAPAAMMATREAEVDLELVSMRKQMQDVTAMVEEMTAAAEARNAAARAANEAAAARAAAAAEKKRNSWGWFNWGSKPCL